MSPSDPQEPEDEPRLGAMGYAPDYRLSLVLDPAGTVRQVIESVGIAGWRDEAVIGRHVGDVAAGGMRGRARAEAWAERLRHAHEAIAPARYSDLRPDAPEGGPSVVTTIVTPVRSADGALESIVVHAYDRSSELTVEARLRESEARFRGLAESLPQMVWITDRDGAAEYFSPRWTEFTGRSMEALLEDGYVDLIHPDDLGILTLADREGTEAVGVYNIRMRDRSGAYRWMEGRARAIHNEHGEIERWVGGTIDVTARREAEDVAREQQEQLRTALAITGLGRYTIYFRERRVVSNDRFAEILGYDPQERMTREGMDGFVRPVHREDRREVIEEFERVIEGQRDEYHMECRIWRDTPEGPETRSVVALGRVEFDRDGPVRFVGVLEDVTDRRREDDAQMRMQKRQALGTLAGGIAHDFNNVIGVILANSVIAETEAQAGESPTTSLAEITRGARRARDLVQRMLDFSREEEPVRTPLYVAGVVEEVCALTRPALTAGTELRARVSPGLPELCGDSTQLHQVLLNLITNASQSIGAAGGLIELLVDAVELGRRGPGADASLPPGQYVRIRVRDDGPGIPEAVIGRVFDPFFTTKPAGQGTGLGLAASQTIVRNHGGWIAAESADGTGTTFTIHLPAGRDAGNAGVGTKDGGAAVGRAEAQGEADALPSTGAAAQAGEAEAAVAVGVAAAATDGGDAAPVRVMFVDDEPALGRAAERMFAVHGFTATTFIDPVRAAAAFEHDPSAFDVLVTDLSMPGLHGLDLAQRLRDLRPQLPIVITSGFMTPADQARAEQLGIDAIVPKPCSLADLIAAVGNVLGAGRRHPPARPADGR